MNNTFRKYAANFKKYIESEKQKPRFPYSEGPREYQKNAYLNWVANNCQGIFAMATGTGKTITSLNCLLEIYNQKKTYKAIILVPTIALVDQWQKECEKFCFNNVTTISSKSDWKDDMSNIITQELLNPSKSSFIIIVTYSSFSKPKFQSSFKELPVQTLLIADEAHNMGSSSILKLLENIHLKKRIGLSATPERQYDEFGNTEIGKFFNSIESYVFTYSMSDAIKNGVLSKYYYYPVSRNYKCTENGKLECTENGNNSAQFLSFQI